MNCSSRGFIANPDRAATAMLSADPMDTNTAFGFNAGLGADAMAQLFLRTAFNVAARNHDDHTKNFAFIMDGGGPWQLSPAFDVTHAYTPNGERTHQHLMSVNGKFDAITESDLLTLASRFGVPSPRSLLDQINAATSRWAEFADEAELTSADANEVEGLLMILKL